MKDKWINIGYEDDEMKPYVEPPKDSNDPARIGQSCIISYHIVSELISLHVAFVFCQRYF